MLKSYDEMTTDREADGVVHQSKHRGDQAVIYEAARSVWDAPRIWWCEVRYMGFTGPASACVTHAKCGWVRLVDDPQEGEEE